MVGFSDPKYFRTCFKKHIFPLTSVKKTLICNQYSKSKLIKQTKYEKF
jgi:hypothetical protein